MTKRYIALKSYKGIRKDTKTGKYQARKYIDGKEYSEAFEKVKDAIKWRNEFYPDLKTESKEIVASKNKSKKLNGVEDEYSFSEIWKRYQTQHLTSLTPQSKYYIIKRFEIIRPYLDKYMMVEFTAGTLDEIIENLVEYFKSQRVLRRYNFDKELKALRAFFNWYRENYDPMFVMPILKRHYILGTLRKKTQKKQKMTSEQVNLFFKFIEEDFWRDFAEIHFYMAGRVQEPAGLQMESVDLEKRVLKVSDVSVWGDHKKFLYLKEIPKNGEERLVHINDRMYEILKRRMEDRSPNTCSFKRESTGEPLNFVFHINGEPITYRQVQHHYNKALKGVLPETRFTLYS